MPETVSGGAQPPKEISMELRLLLAFLLMGAVMFLTPYFFKSQTPPGKKAPAAAVVHQPGAPAVPTTPAAPATTASAEAAQAPVAPATSAQALPPLVVQTNLFRVTFSNQGATVRSWLLEKYKDNDNKPLELTNTAAGQVYPFSLYFPGRKPATDVNKAYYTQTADPDGLGVTYTFSDGHTQVRKSFQFQKNSYLLQVTSEVTIDGKPVTAMIEWRGGFGDLTVPNPANAEHAIYYNQADNKIEEIAAKTAAKGPVTASGNFSFAGIEDQYFAAAFLPRNSATVEQVTFSNTARTVLDAKEMPFVGVGVADGTTNRFDLFVGPKDLNILRAINPKLEQLVNFGFFSILAKPLFLIVNWTNNAFVHNYGWSIVLVTVAITFALFPLRLSNMKSMKKMQALKPQIDAINAKYKNVKMTDPRAGEKNQEVMELYKKNGVNPMGGCFPMLIQLPFFYAFYKVFTVAIEMRGASWLWVSDLSQPEHISWMPGIHPLPIIMIASQFFMQKMTPQPAGDPNQRKMMLLMPLLFGFMFYNFPSGLVLYYLTSNLVSMGQQWFFNRTDAALAAERSVEPPRKKNGRK